MKKTVIALLMTFGTGLPISCDRAKNEVLPDGTKVFAKRTLKDGTTTDERVEYPNGRKDFQVTEFPDGTQKIVRIEFFDGERHFGVTNLPDRTERAERVELANGARIFGVTVLPDGTQKKARIELPNGEKLFEVTKYPDGTETIVRATRADGTEIPTFSPVQNDTEGYDQHVWEISVDDFRKRVRSFDDNYFRLSPGKSPSDDDFVGYYSMIALKNLLGVPNASKTPDAYFADRRFQPTDLSSYFDSGEKVYYFFRKERLAWVVVALDSKVQSISESIKAKYPFVTATNFRSSDRLNGFYTIQLYKRGNTNTRLYYVHYQGEDTPDWPQASIYRRADFLIYIPDSIEESLAGEVRGTIHADENRRDEQTQAAKQANEKRIQ